MKTNEHKVKIAILAVSFCCIFGTVLPANAIIVSGDFTGLVYDDHDGTADALFGLAPGTLIGQPIDGTFSYDTTQLGVAYSGTGETLWGGTAGSFHVTETINGVTVAFNGGYYDALDIQNGGPGVGGRPAAQAFQLNSYDAGPGNSSISTSVLTVLTAHQNPGFIGDPGNPAVAFSLSDIANTTGSDFGLGQGSWTSGQEWSFYIDDISAAVPEPTSLALFAFGAGGISVFGKRRGIRRTAAGVAPLAKAGIA